MYKRPISVTPRLFTGVVFNILLLYWIFNISPKAYSSTEYHYTAIDLARDAASCFLPLLALPLLLPVILIAKDWPRLLACALLVIPVGFSCIACFAFIPEFFGVVLGDSAATNTDWRGPTNLTGISSKMDLVFGPDGKLQYYLQDPFL